MEFLVHNGKNPRFAVSVEFGALWRGRPWTLLDGVPEAGILKLVDLSGGVRPGEARVEVSIPLIKDF